MGEKLQSINRSTLFLILILCTSVPLFFPVKLPNRADAPSMDLYQKLMTLPEGSTVLVQSDWTNSTRGESGGQFNALMRILMRRHIKACIYTAADPQAPEVARNAIAELNKQQDAAHLPEYKEWDDWVHLGFFPSAEGTSVSIGTDVRKAFAGKKATQPNGTQADVFESPVLKNIHAVRDFPLMILITASNTSNVAIERLYGKVPLAMMVTGVMGPETQVYYDSHQLVGLSKGLKGVYDIENMMQDGAKIAGQTFPPFTGPGVINKDLGTRYYPTLHMALLLLIVAVVVGNVGMFLSRKRSTQ
ncbi:MAG TPA: hypothetical protein VHE55_18410 [Fimbriimonadaceae bacterium]|nr:hypothetical protein [Fimbriimonadaceae bacterium]